MRILLVYTGWLGDVIMSSVIIKPLRKHFPDAKIDVFTMFSSSKQFMEMIDDVDDIFYYPMMEKGLVKSLFYLRELREYRYDISIMFFPSYRKEYAIVSYLIGAKKRMGFKFPKGYFTECGFLYTDLIEVDESIHNVSNAAKILEKLGLDIPEDLDLPFPNLHDTDINDFFLNKEYIFLHNGVSTTKGGSKYRKLPDDVFMDLIVNLIERKQFLVINKGPNETFSARASDFLKGLEIDGKIIIWSSEDLFKTAQVIANSRLIISTDSGIHHLAASLKKPIVLVLSFTSEKLISPWNTKYIVVRDENLSCSPCYTSYTKKSFECINQSKWQCRNVEISAIIEALNMLWKNDCC